MAPGPESPVAVAMISLLIDFLSPEHAKLLPILPQKRGERGYGRQEGGRPERGGQAGEL